MASSGHKHYRNSKVSMSNFEPVYLNLFEVILTPPPSVDKWEYVLEQITKISGMTTDQIPGAGVEQSYKGAKRRFAGALPDTTTVDLTIGFNVNVDDDASMIAYKGMRNWSNLIWNPLTGVMMLKKDYIGGPLTVFLHNKIDNVLREWIFPVVFPTSPLNDMGLDYSDGNAIYSVESTFAADFWDDMSK